jgi:hypothetical protein
MKLSPPIRTTSDWTPATEGEQTTQSLFTEHYLHLVRLAATLVDDQEAAEETSSKTSSPRSRENDDLAWPDQSTTSSSR